MLYLRDYVNLSLGMKYLRNRRMVEVGRDPWGSSSPTSPAEAGSPRAGYTGPCPGGSWISPQKETPQPLWAACSSAPSPQREEVLPHVQTELPVLQFVPIS